MTASCGRQVRFRISSSGVEPIGFVMPANGILVKTSSPRMAAAARACSSRSGGTVTENSASFIAPLDSSSMRDNSERRMRNEDGTTPLASPECTPSLSTRTVSFPGAMPRRLVVSQS